MASWLSPYPLLSSSCCGKAQRACRGQAGDVPVTLLLLLDGGRAVAAIAEDLGLDEATGYRYAQAYQLQGLAGYLRTEQPGYLRTEQPGYWGLLTHMQPAGRCRELGQQVYTDCWPVADWLAATYGVRYAVSGLTDRLHRLDANAWVALSYKLTMALPCQTDAAAQTAFLSNRLAPLLAQTAAGDAVVYFADAAHPTHNTRATHVRTETGQERPVLTISGRERVNHYAARHAARNAQSPQRRSEKRLAGHPQGPEHVICDNARRADKRLVQVFLPPYSPNLNLIERLWKFLRQKISNPALYRTKGPFKTAVLDFFDRLPELDPERASNSTSWIRNPIRSKYK